MPWLIPVALAVAGAAAGSMKDKSSTKNTSGLNLDPETDLEKRTSGTINNSYTDLEALLNGSYEANAGQRSNSAYDDLDAMLKEYAKTGGVASSSDIAAAGSYTDSIFAPRSTALNQSFIDQQVEASRLAAKLGRPVNDPVIQAKLRTEKMRADERLGADKTAFSADFAQQISGNRLGFTGQRADLAAQRAQTALSNRQMLLGLGTGLRDAERGFRINTAERYGTSETESGGGLKGAITGGISGFGAGMGASSAMGGGGMGQGGGMPAGQSAYFAAPTAGPTAPGSSWGMGSTPYQGYDPRGGRYGNIFGRNNGW